MRESEGLPEQLRRETADLHLAVEASTGLPGSLRSREDYVLLLQRLHGFHSAAETLLADPRWAWRWAGAGIDLTRHRRAHLLEEDLSGMQARPRSPAPDVPEAADFASALGWLYVVEGSSLGGRVIGPAIRSAIGDVPIAFFISADRGHPRPWRAVQGALHRFEKDGDRTAVLSGARSAFHAFERLVAVRGGVQVR